MFFVLEVGPDPGLGSSSPKATGWVGRQLQAAPCCSFLLFIYLFIFRERGREGEREGEKHQCVVASHMAPIGDLACNPGMCPRLGIEPATLWFAACTQSTELH